MKNSLLLLPVIVSVGLWHANAATQVDFAKEIQPLLTKNCIKCHGPEKQKGKLRLDSKEAALKAGAEVTVIAPGDAEKSDLFRRVTLPAGHDDIMPPEGDPLTKAQTDLLKEWINQGANWPEGLTLKEATAPAPAEAVLPADFKPHPNEAKAIATLAQAGVDVRPIAMNMNWREANFRLQGTNITDMVLAPVKDIASLVELNLATTRVTDAGLAQIKGLTNLLRLHLELTQVTDAGLKNLTGLTNLTYLNLYSTAVTDAGLEHLKALPRLRKLYVWQSKVTEAGVNSLKASLPSVEISTGWDLAALLKKEEAKKEEKSDEKKPDEKPEEKKPEEKKKAEEKQAEEKKAEEKKPEAKKEDEEK